MVGRALLAIVLVSSPAVLAQERALPSTDDLIQALRMADETAKEAIVRLFTNRPARSVDDRAISVLSSELGFQTEIDIQRLSDIAHGHVPEPRDGEYRNLVERVLAQQENPLAIPALVRAVGNKGAGFESLIRFGEAAVPALIVGCRENRGTANHIRYCLDALEQMLERPAIASTLSDGSRDQIKEVARERMRNPQRDPDISDPEARTGDPFVLASAAYLGAATRDPELRRMTVALTTDATTFDTSRVDRKWIPYVSNLLRQALAKFPASQ